MSKEKDLKKGNGTTPEVEVTEEEVEGYAYCDSHKQKCLNDCSIIAPPVISELD